MSRQPAGCPEHVWASIGVTVLAGEVSRIWNRERCVAWIHERLDPNHRIDWETTALSQ